MTIDKADELREQMREERKKNGRQRKLDILRDSSNTDNTTQGRTTGGGHVAEPAESAENGPRNGSGGSVQHAISTVSGRTHDNQGHDSTTTNPQGKLVSSSGSTSQDNRRTGPGTRRSGEDNSEDRSNGVDIRESVSGGQSAVTPILVGNLIRNVEEEEKTYVPPRNFTPEFIQPPIVGEQALIIRDGKPVRREPKGIKKDAARAVESLKAVIPKAKRGRPSTKPIPENVEAAPKSRLTEKLKEAGQAIPHGNKLTEKEIEELREPLQAALTDEFDQLDKLLWLYEGAESIQQPIWSDINDHEMEKLVNALLNMGTRSATAATIARASVDLSDYIIAGTLLAPRLQSTATLVGQVRKKKKILKGRGH